MSAELKLDDFLHSLIVFMAAGAGSLAVGSTPRALWREVADESKSGNCADPFSVVRSYGGGPATWKDQALDRRSFQCVTLGKVRSATVAQAEKLYATLRDAAGQPLRMKEIDSYLAATGAAEAPGKKWRMVFVDLLQAPYPLGIDEQKRHQVVFNFETGFLKLA
jgi:hypothetical protein